MITAASTNRALAIGARVNVPVPDPVEVRRAMQLRERPGGKERHGFRQRVIGHVQERPEDPRLARRVRRQWP